MADAEQLRRAIEAQEQLHGTLPDAVIDAAGVVLHPGVGGARRTP
jgi:hypothetical protein